MFLTGHSLLNEVSELTGHSLSNEVSTLVTSFQTRFPYWSVLFKKGFHTHTGRRTADAEIKDLYLSKTQSSKVLP